MILVLGPQNPENGKIYYWSMMGYAQTNPELGVDDPIATSFMPGLYNDLPGGGGAPPRLDLEALRAKAIQRLRSVDWPRILRENLGARHGGNRDRRRAFFYAFFLLTPSGPDGIQ